MQLLHLHILGLILWIASLLVLFQFHDELQLLLQLCLIILLAAKGQVGGASTLVGRLFFVLWLLLVLVLAIIVVLCWLSILHVLNHLLLEQKGVHLT